MIIATKSYLHMDAFALSLGKNRHCYSLHHLDLTTGATSRTPETAFPIISGKKLNRKPSSLFMLFLKQLPCLNPF